MEKHVSICFLSRTIKHINSNIKFLHFGIIYKLRRASLCWYVSQYRVRTNLSLRLFLTSSLHQPPLHNSPSANLPLYFFHYFVRHCKVFVIIIRHKCVRYVRATCRAVNQKFHIFSFTCFTSPRNFSAMTLH